MQIERETVDAPALLHAEQLNVRYGRQIAVRAVDLQLARGESVALAGANGAGKTSLLTALAGVVPPGAALSGRVTLDGRAHDLAGRRRAPDPAIALVPERGKVFGLLTVEENLRVARGAGLAGARLTSDDVYGWFPRLRERRRTLAGNLSGGEQQMLGIGMGLMRAPRVLLLDEPTLGLAVPVIEEVCERLAALRDALGLTLLVAESDSQWLPRLAQRALIIDRGALVHRVGRLDAAQLDAIHDILLGIGATASPLSDEVGHV
ncbi:ABC transporter ATP-binding protein [Chitinasiproducens palmae]|uniref:ABC transporter ATP-binding protein n=1 Tax=Chitinasiproducens palmae TaxID=1770053 RepID=UPI00147A12A2|nr:ATP-binding cassette domain-containing protein [Chitinasiproducens palmae]